MRALLEEGDWQDVFHAVLPRFPILDRNGPPLSAAEVNDMLTVYRAGCQVELGKWMAAREQEVFLRQRK